MEGNYFSLSVSLSDEIFFVKTGVIEGFITVHFTLQPKYNQNDTLSASHLLQKNNELKLLINDLIDDEIKKKSKRLAQFGEFDDDGITILIKDENNRKLFKQPKTSLDFNEIIDSIQQIIFGDEIILNIAIKFK